MKRALTVRGTVVITRVLSMFHSTCTLASTSMLPTKAPKIVHYTLKMPKLSKTWTAAVRGTIVYLRRTAE